MGITQRKQDRHSGNATAEATCVLLVQITSLFLQDELVDELVLLWLHFRQGFILNTIPGTNIHIFSSSVFMLIISSINKFMILSKKCLTILTNGCYNFSEPTLSLVNCFFYLTITPKDWSDLLLYMTQSSLLNYRLLYNSHLINVKSSHLNDCNIWFSITIWLFHFKAANKIHVLKGAKGLV